MKKGYTLYLILCFVFLMFPFAAMFFAGEEAGDLPSLKDEGAINRSYLNDMGDYFSEHFAFRDEFLSANAYVYDKLFHVSSTNQVLLGKNDTMYYTNTLNDYTATHLMTERGLNNVVHNLKLMQDYVENNGSHFLLTIAPNKNSLYGEDMPYYYPKADMPNNYAKLEPKLAEYGIHYVNLFEAFKQQNDKLYLKWDSHWTNQGAVLAYNEIMKHTDLNYETYEGISFEEKKEHAGDLVKMLYPSHYGLEENVYYQKDFSYQYVGEVKDNMDDFIATVSPKSSETILMYRDSFGESLLPFFAEEFGQGYFSRLVPYNFYNVVTYQPDYVVVERVERRISSFAEEGAFLDFPVVSLEPESLQVIDKISVSDFDKQETGSEANDSLNVRKNGDFYEINGSLNGEHLPDDVKIYIGIRENNGAVTYYDTFWISRQVGEAVNDFGFYASLVASELPENIASVEVAVK